MCPQAGLSRGTDPSKAKGFYSRLFPLPATPLTQGDEEKLVRLGQSMRYVAEREGILTPRVGFTYFGQFVGHDLTHDPTPLAGPYVDPEMTPNFRTPFLNLEQIYGGGPASSPHLYEGEQGMEVFKIGTTLGDGYRRDLPIESGEVLVADNRNLDNLILRQLHVVFLKFHNEAVKQLSASSLMLRGCSSRNSGTVFERAQRLVRWHYQWIVRHDFLPRILHYGILQRGTNLYEEYPDSNGNFSIPVEFSLAAYRFGHSMVRNAYGLNCRRPRVELAELMALGSTPSQIPDDCLIEWGRFFDGLPASGQLVASSYLDTALVLPLHGLAQSVVRLCIESELGESRVNLPVRTLLRGARAKLPSGQEVAERLIQKKILKEEYRLTKQQVCQETYNHSGAVLKDLDLQDNTPLFYYILKEAEILGQGRTLGPTGSSIVSQVILGALRFDPGSYLSVVGPSWQLPAWRFPSGGFRQINSLTGIIRLVGDDRLLPECDAHWRHFQLDPWVCHQREAKD
jgi:Animal haem peroxidase